MSVWSLFTSFHGRIRRASWWVGGVILVPADMAGDALPAPALQTAWSVLLLIPVTALTVKRFNDRDWPSWLGYAFGVSAAGIIIADRFVINVENLTALEWAVLAPWTAFALFTFVDNGFLPGTPGPNRHGPDSQKEWF